MSVSMVDEPEPEGPVKTGCPYCGEVVDVLEPVLATFVRPGSDLWRAVLEATEIARRGCRHVDG